MKWNELDIVSIQWRTYDEPHSDSQSSPVSARVVLLCTRHASEQLWELAKASPIAPQESPRHYVLHSYGMLRNILRHRKLPSKIWADNPQNGIKHSTQRKDNLPFPGFSGELWIAIGIHWPNAMHADSRVMTPWSAACRCRIVPWSTRHVRWTSRTNLLEAGIVFSSWGVYGLGVTILKWNHLLKPSSAPTSVYIHHCICCLKLNGCL